jgi:hypothetical protein
VAVQTSGGDGLKGAGRPVDGSGMKRTVTIMIAGLVAVFALGACGAATDAVGDGAKGAIESATGCKANGDGDDAKVECKTDKGSFSAGAGTELPDGFPKSDVPLPEGEIVSSISTDVDGKAAYNVTVKVDGSVGKAADDYQSELEDKGFTVDGDSSFSIGGGIVGFQAESSDWDVNVVGAGGTSGADSNGLVVTVTEHDSSSDTTDTSS